MKRILGIGAAALLAGCSTETVAPNGLTEVPGALVVTGWTSGVPLNAGTGGNVQWSTSLTAGDIGPAQVIVAPDTVSVGEPFEVTTYTIGLSGCWRGDGQTTQLQGSVVEIRPYDSHSGSELCTGMIVFIDHRSTLQLSSAGEWTLRVQGRRLRVGDETWWEPIAAEKSIHVR